MCLDCAFRWTMSEAVSGEADDITKWQSRFQERLMSVLVFPNAQYTTRVMIDEKQWRQPPPYPIPVHIDRCCSEIMEGPPGHMKLMLESGSLDNVFAGLVCDIQNITGHINAETCLFGQFCTAVLSHPTDPEIWLPRSDSSIILRIVGLNLCNLTNSQVWGELAIRKLTKFLDVSSGVKGMDIYRMRLIANILKLATVDQKDTLLVEPGILEVGRQPPSTLVLMDPKHFPRDSMVESARDIINACPRMDLRGEEILQEFRRSIVCLWSGVRTVVGAVQHDVMAVFYLSAALVNQDSFHWKYLITAMNRVTLSANVKPRTYLVPMYYGARPVYNTVINETDLAASPWDPSNSVLFSKAEDDLQMCNAIYDVVDSLVLFILYHQRKTWPILARDDQEPLEPVYVRDHPWLDQIPHRTLMGYAINGLLKTAVHNWPIVRETTYVKETGTFVKLDECRTIARRKLEGKTKSSDKERVDGHEMDLYFMRHNKHLLSRQREYLLFSCAMHDCDLTEEHKLAILRQIVIDDLLINNPPLE